MHGVAALATSSPALPFSLLLDVLRARGMAVGLHDYVSLGRLLSRFDDTRPGTLRSAFAALLAKDAREQQLVGDVFDELFGDMLHRAGTTDDDARRTHARPADASRRSKPRRDAGSPARWSG